jgi:hypothetical protein
LNFKHSTIPASSAVDPESKTGELALSKEPGKLRHSPHCLKDRVDARERTVVNDMFGVETNKGLKEHTRIIQILNVTLNALSQIAEGGWKLVRKLVGVSIKVVRPK